MEYLLFILINKYSKSIIITAGNNAFQPRKSPINVPQKIEDKVHSFINDFSKFLDRKVLSLVEGIRQLIGP